MTLTTLLLSACVSRPPLAGVPRDMPEVVSRRFGDITVHLVNAGWVRVKEAHRTLAGAAAMRFPAIVFDRRWTEWMPILVGIIDHPEGVYIVDTGLSEAMLDSEHFACDGGTSFVYRHLLAFQFAREQRIDRRLAELGIASERVRGIVLTHRHADHEAGLAHLPASARVFVGQGDWPSHTGALPCRWPDQRTPTLVSFPDGPIAAFQKGEVLTRDGSLAVVPLHGHSPGHQGVLVRLDGLDLLFAGDAAFSTEQVTMRRLAGIVELPDAARAALDTLALQAASYPTVTVFAHDADSMRRFADGPDPTSGSDAHQR